MKKYTIDDLIIDEPIPEIEKSEQKPKGKYTTIVLIAIVLIVGVFLAKMLTDPSADIDTTKEEKIATSDTVQLPEPKQEVLVPGEQEAEKVDTELSNATTKTKSQEPSAAEAIIDVITAAKTKEVPKQKQETIVSTEQKPQKISDLLPVSSTKSTPPSEPKPESKNSKNLLDNNVSVHYIQVGVFNREPTESFLSKINDAGLDYVVAKSGKTRRVRVGPYGSFESAKNSIGKINDVIGIEGLIVKSSTRISGEPKSVYYIQVGVFNREPKESFLSKINDAGLDFIVAKSGKTRRVRVGPYGSFESANNSIGKINDAIGIEGLIVKSSTGMSW